MHQDALVRRLKEADPGWPEWKRLIDLVRSLSFSSISDEHLGTYLAAGDRLTFAVPPPILWPAWVPTYVPALFGMKAAEYEWAGGYAAAFDGRYSQAGKVFSCGPPDAELGFPPIPVPADCHPFQCNAKGALFHLDAKLKVRYPDARRGQMSVLDTLEAFTRKNLDEALGGRPWFRAYDGLQADLVD